MPPTFAEAAAEEAVATGSVLEKTPLERPSLIGAPAGDAVDAVDEGGGAGDEGAGEEGEEEEERRTCTLAMVGEEDEERERERERERLGGLRRVSREI